MATYLEDVAEFKGFRSLCEHSPDAISLLDEQGAILYGSSANTKLFGYFPEQLIGRNYIDLIHPDDRDRSNRALLEVISKPLSSLQWEARACRQDGSYFWVESTVCNLLTEVDVQALVLYQRNVSERKAAEDEKQRQALKLTLSNVRLEEFAYTAAHDLREPLRAISLYTEVLVSKWSVDDDTRKITQVIVDSVSRMFTVIDDLLTYARTGKQAPRQRVNLASAVAEAVRTLQLDIVASNAVVTVDRLPVVYSNELQLVRLFQNLISNAVKYRDERRLQIHVSAQPRGPDWEVRIQDNGLGIALPQQERVFSPFVRLANRAIPGTGLGLAVCRKIVEGMGGKIWMESKSGVGSSFFFTITANAGQVHSGEQAQEGLAKNELAAVAAPESYGR